MSHQRSVKVYELGMTSYREVHKLQQRLQTQRREGGGVDSLLLTEHRPVITLGRSHPEPSLRAPADVVASHGIEIVQTERGGDITYHGPGQLVAYAIVDLRAWECSVLDFVTGLEEAVIEVLADWGVPGERVARARGVWVEGRKIASVGLHVRRWVTMHGIAFNIDPDMSHFDLINPCGMSDIEMTSLSAEVGKQVRLGEVSDAFTFQFGRAFDCRLEAGQVGKKAAAE